MRRTDFDRTVNRPSVPIASGDKSRRKMKCIISIGLILPALAAVIGVVAWAVSADIVMGHARDKVAASNLRLENESPDDAVLQERSDLLYDEKLPVGGKVNEMQLIDNKIPPISSTAKTGNNDPTFYVMPMVVPTQKSTTSAPTKSSTSSSGVAVTDVNEFLSRIISASKGSDKIFVVPIPASLANGQKVYEKSASKFDEEEEEDEGTTLAEEEDEVVVTSHRPKVSSTTKKSQSGPRRSGDPTYDDNIRTYHPVKSEGDYAPPQQKTKQQQPYNPPKSYYTQSHNSHNSQAQQSHASQAQSQHHYVQKQSQQYPPPQHPQPHLQAHPPQPPPQQYRLPPHSRPHHPPPNFEQVSGNRNYVPKPAPQAPVSYFQQPVEPLPPKTNRDSQQGYDSNRWGSVDGGGYEHGHGHELPPKGITVTFGSNHGGGGYAPSYHHPHHIEPLGVIKSLFLPFLPKPKVNLNGRVVFGVVLEKGVGLGGNKGHGGLSLGGFHH